MNINDQIENLPGYDVVMELWNEFAEEKLQTKDPFYVEVDGEERRRKPPEGLTNDEKQVWKHVVSKAWTHDRCFCGCFWADLGLGSAPLVSIVPVIGPLVMLAVHGRLVRVAEEVRIPAKLHAKMSANITFDFLVSLIPVVGAFFEFMNQCSARNAALFDTYMRARGEARRRQLGPFRLVEQPQHTQRPTGQVSGSYS